MPSYNARCPKGHNFEAFQSFADYDRKLPLLCPDHEVEGVRQMSAPAIGGTSSFKMHPHDVVQLGRTFNSAREQDKWMKANNIESVHKDEVIKHAGKKPSLSDNPDFQKSKRELYAHINAAGGVEDGGKILKVDDNGKFKKVN